MLSQRKTIYTMKHSFTSSITSTRMASNLRVCLSSIWQRLPKVATSIVGGSACNISIALQALLFRIGQSNRCYIERINTPQMVTDSAGSIVFTEN